MAVLFLADLGDMALKALENVLQCKDGNYKFILL